MAPPSPERRPERLEAHGDVRIDDWYWLRDKDDPAVIAHLKAENAYTEAAMAGTAGLRQALFDEMVARIEETDLSVPVKKGPWLYYGRTVEGSSYGIHCRRPADGSAEVGGRGGRAVGPVPDPVPPKGSPPTRRSCWTRTSWPRDTSTSPSGTSRSARTTAGWPTPPTRPAASGTPCASSTWRAGGSSPEALEDTSYGVAWANDNATVFYVRVDEAMRPYQLWRHRVGGDQAADTLVYEEADDRFYLGVGRTKDDRYVLLGPATPR